MADENPTAHGVDSNLTDVEQEELHDEALILDRVLSQWPISLQDSDLIREMLLDGTKFADRDRVDRAILQLRLAGLVVRCGPVVVPTRAALHYRLLGEQAGIDL